MKTIVFKHHSSQAANFGDNHSHQSDRCDVGLKERIDWLIMARSGGKKPNRREFARRGGLDPQHINTLMSRLAKNPKATAEGPTLAGIARAGNVTVDWLLAEGDIVPPQPIPSPTIAPGDPRQPRDVRGRVWLALHALPRNDRGRPPSLESFKDLPFVGKQVHKLLAAVKSGAKLSLNASDAALLGAALHVAPDWLQKGSGDAPEPSGPIEPQRPPEHEQVDIEALATNAQGDIDPNRLAGRNTWADALAAGYASELKPSAVKRIKAKHFDPSNPGATPLPEWKKIFHQAMRDPKSARKRGPRKRSHDGKKSEQRKASAS